MCGRYALTVPRERLATLLGAVAASEFDPRYNISPGQTVQAVASENGRRLLQPYRWGFSTPYATEDRSAPLLFNARAETAAQKPAFRTALQMRRCVAPADAWYEWRTIGRFKQPYLVRRVDREPVMFASLWESWEEPDGARRRALTILTVAAGEDVAHIHDRMPAVLTPDHIDAWLDMRVEGTSLALRCLKPAPAGMFEAIAIGARINQLGNDGPEVQEPAPERPVEEGAQPRLV